MDESAVEMYDVYYFAQGPIMEPGPSMEDMEHHVRQTYNAINNLGPPL